MSRFTKAIQINWYSTDDILLSQMTKINGRWVETIVLVRPEDIGHEEEVANRMAADIDEAMRGEEEK